MPVTWIKKGKSKGQVVVRSGRVEFITHPDTAVEMGFEVPGYHRQPNSFSASANRGGSPDYRPGVFPVCRLIEIPY